MQPTKSTQFIVSAIIMYIIFGSSIWADPLIPKVAPIADIYIPQGEYKQLAPARPLTEYPLLKETPKSYLILYMMGTNSIIGLIPKLDRLNNPTANVDGNKVVIRSLANTAIYEGSTPYEKNKRYDVVGESETGYMAIFTSGEYSSVCELAKTSVVYISEADLRREQEAAMRKEEERKIEAAKQAAEKLKREQEAAAEKLKREQKAAADKQRREQESLAEQKRQEEGIAVEQAHQQDAAAVEKKARQEQEASEIVAQMNESAFAELADDRVGETQARQVLSAVDLYKMMGSQKILQQILRNQGDPLPVHKTMTEHGVNELVEYINGKLSFIKDMPTMLKYVASIDQWVFAQFIRGELYAAYVFRLDQLNPDKVMTQRAPDRFLGGAPLSSVVLYTHNYKRTVVFYRSRLFSPDNSIIVSVNDEDDAQKVGRAMQELIIAYGGKGEML